MNTPTTTHTDSRGAARILEKSMVTTRRLALNGRIPSEKLGGRLIYRVADLERFAAACRLVRGTLTD